MSAPASPAPLHGLSSDEIAAIREIVAKRPPVQEHPLKRHWQTIASIVAVLGLGWQLNVEVGRIVERVDTVSARLRGLEALPSRVAVLESEAANNDQEYARYVKPGLDEIRAQLNRVNERLAAIERGGRRKR